MLQDASKKAAADISIAFEEIQIRRAATTLYKIVIQSGFSIAAEAA